MPYQINKFNGDRLVVLEDGTLDTTTSIGLVGKNFAGYGEIQNENMLWMLENFAGEGAPPKAIAGQLWYDTIAQRIKVYTGTAWRIVGNTEVSDTQPVDVAPGDGWINSTTKQFFVYDGTAFRVVGPEVAQGFGDTRAVSARVLDSQGGFAPIIKFTVNDTVLAIITDRSFTLNNQNPIAGFSALTRGINYASGSTIAGDLNGNAATASRLEVAREINGVDFDGSQNVTIKASTTNNLVAGQYLSGSNFDGSSEITWTVDATSFDVEDTVVARDSNGNFRAGTITADLVGNSTGTHYGNVQGNITGNVLGDLTGNVSGTVTGNVNGNVTGSVTGNVIGSLKGSVINNDDSIAYDVNSKTFNGTFNGNASSATRLETARRINGVLFDGGTDITVVDSTKLPLTGGILTGLLQLSQDPTADLHATTKQYVDARDQNVYDTVLAALPPNYTITYGNTQYSTSGFTNIVGGFSNGANFFDVYPPSGKTMADLVAFLPSIAVIHYAGRVDGNDSLRCTWSNLGNRIRVYVQNTEQRSTPAANWIAIWR